MKKLTLGKEMPVVYRHVLSTEWCRQFSILDRIKILFGGMLVVMIKIPTQHSPGKIHPIIAGEVTKETTPSNFLKSQMENILVEQKDDQ